jgi:hypothetical protein
MPGVPREVLAAWGNKPKVEFAFIDGVHEYEIVSKNFGMVYPLVKDGGWIALNGVQPELPGPWQVWRQTARPLLEDHQCNASLACGRKTTG